MKNLLLISLLHFLSQNIFSQNVGIGTTNPTKGTLVVRGTVGAVSALFGDNTTGVAIENSYPGIGLNSYYNGGRKAISTGFGGLVGLNPNNGDFYIISSSESINTDASMSSNFRMLINKDGNIGVQGVSAPTMPLTFNNILGNKIALFGQSANAHYGIGVQAAMMQMYTPTAADDITFGIGSSTSFTENMRITGDGKVGIGTDQPSQKLDVIGTISGTNETGVGVHGIASTGTGLYGESISGTGIIAFSNNGTGINTSSFTGLALEVNGKLKIHGGNSNPSAGAVLTSDASGNAIWKKTNVGFKVAGDHNVHHQFLSGFENELHYGQEDYDYANNFNYMSGSGTPLANDDVFTAPTSGLYNFNSQVYLLSVENTTILTGVISIYVRRAGQIVSQIQSDGHYIRNSTNSMILQVSGDLKLQSGDQVFVTIYQQSINASRCNVLGNYGYCYFNGHLVFEN